MTTELNLDCLEYIFGFLTPLEWIQVSEVCKLWKLAALRRWRKITEITYTECSFEIERMKLDEINPPIISTQDAEKIFIHAAPFVKVLKYFTLLSRYDKYKYTLFGQFCYKMMSFSAENSLEQLAQNSTEIIDICFDVTPKKTLLQLLFKNNKIRKLSVFQTFQSSAFYKHIPTHGIEDLHVRFMKYNDVGSFKRYFSNLKKLTLELDCFWIAEARQIVPTILPYVAGIKSLILKIRIDQSLTDKPYKFFRDIFKMSQLEELSIILDYFDHEILVESFINKLVQSCTKLRAVQFHGYYFNESALHSLMSLPNLESLDIMMAKGFCSKELPEMKNLKKCRIRFTCQSTVIIASLCNAISKMPKLESLNIEGLDEEETLKFVCEAILAVASQKEDNVLIKFEYIQGYKTIEIERKNDWKSAEFYDEKFQILNLKISRYEEEKYFERLKMFVQKKLRHKTIKF